MCVCVCVCVCVCRERGLYREIVQGQFFNAHYQQIPPRSR